VTFLWQVAHSDQLRPLSRAAVTFPAGGDHLRLARHQRSGWRRRETFPAAAANSADPVIRTNKG